jgi:hypothetical protein
MQRTNCNSLRMQLLMLHELPIRKGTTNNLIKIHLVIYVIIVGVEVTARSAIINKIVNNGIVYCAWEKCSLCLCPTLFYCGFIALDGIATATLTYYSYHYLHNLHTVKAIN